MEDFINNFISQFKKENIIPKSNGRNDTLSFLCRNNNYKVCLEFGVFTGGTLNFISNFCSKLIGFDSFEGLPDNWDIGSQVIRKGHFKTNIPKINTKNTTLEIGLFQDTLVQFLEKNINLNFDMIHFDMDIYSAAYFVFDTLIKYDKLRNVTIIFDELINFPNFENGEMKALYEMVTKYNLKYKIIGTHGNILNINDFKRLKLKNESFHNIRLKGFYQECAIKILDYELPKNVV